MISGSPVLSEKTFERFQETIPQNNTMTIQGTSTKALILLAVVSGCALATIMAALSFGKDSGIIPLAMLGSLAGFILSLIICFKPTTAPYLSPLYAACEGVFLGIISCLFGLDIAAQAVCATLGVAFTMFVLFRLQIIRATNKVKMAVICAGLALVGVYFLTAILGLFGIPVPFIHETGMGGIIFNLFVIGLAAMFLILDFDQIKTGVEMGAPKYMEWYCAFSLMVTLIWIYLEVVKLLLKRK